MSQNVLLINPYIYDFSAYDLWLKPLGLLYLGAMLQENGFEPVLLDCLDRLHPKVLEMQGLKQPKSRKYGVGNFYREIIDRPEQFAYLKRYYARYGMPPQIVESEMQRIKQEKPPKLILITSSMTYWYRGVHELIGFCKKIFPEIPVILGGGYATLCYDHAVRYSGADVVVQGQGETALPVLVEQYTGQKLKQYPTPDDYPMPAYDLYPNLESVSMLTTRGCPYHCSFCATHQFTKRFRKRSKDKVIEEMTYYHDQLKIQNIAFYDDALFIDSKSHIKPILREIIQRKLELYFHTPNGLFARMIDQELADLVVESGFKTIRLSYESKSPERQRQMKKVRDCDLANALEYLEKSGFPRNEITVYLLMGLPHQLPQEVENSIQYVNSLGAKVSLSSFSPIPSTPDWQIAVEEFNFDPSDPVYGNKSLYPLHREQFTLEDFEKLKRMGIDYNHRLSQ